MSYHAAFHHKITSHAEEVPIVPVVDAHLHFVDFIQESDGIQRLVAAMDAGRISKAVLFGLPVKKKWDKYAFWRGIGEVLCRHDDLTNMTNEETARVNHLALCDVYELCASRSLPVLIHQNSTSVSIHDDYEHLDELEEVLLRFPKTTFVWAHCGISRRVYHKNYHEMVSTLLGRNPHLYVDISWIVYDDVISSELEPKKHWLETISRHADRFCLGSDLCGHFEHLGKSLARYNGLLRRLTPRTRNLVASGNPERIWFGRGARRSGARPRP